MSDQLLWYIWEEDDTAKLFKFVAERYHYRFTHLTTFHAAFALLPHERPHVIIAKRSLARIDDGIAFCQYIRTQAPYHTTPIILGYADLGGKRFADVYQAGANRCFGRVFDIEGVFTMVTTLQTNPLATHLMDQPEWQPRRRAPDRSDSYEGRSQEESK